MAAIGLSVVFDAGGAGFPSEGWPGIEGASSLARTLVAGASLFGAVATVMFLMWVHRTVKNVALLGRPIAWTPSRAVLAYLVPILFWWRPYMAMKAVLAASDPAVLPDVPVYVRREAADYRGGAREAVAPPRWSYVAPVLPWWLLFNLRYAVPNLVAVGLNPGWPIARPLSWALDVAAAVCCALVIHAVNARQRELCRRLDAALGDDDTVA